MPLFESDAWCTFSPMKISFYLHVNKNSFERLYTRARFKKRYKTTQKWPIEYILEEF